MTEQSLDEKLIATIKLPDNTFRRCRTCGRSLRPAIFMRISPLHLSGGGNICSGDYPPDPENYPISIPDWVRNKNHRTVSFTNPMSTSV